MKTARVFTIAFIVVMLSMPLFCFFGLGQQTSIGWQHSDFEDNIELDYSPVVPKPSEPIVITVTSREPDVTIQIAYAEIEITYPGGAISTGGRTFQRINETVMRTSIGPYMYNGTVVKFYLNVLDYNNVPMLSPDVVLTVVGEERTGGWVHDDFEENIRMNWEPTVPNATEPMTVAIESIEGVPIEGANLYFLYTPSNGITESGGWTFDRINLTAMEREIPGNFHAAGTNISFWVIAWDEYSSLTKSESVDYSLAGIVQFKYPFDYTRDEEGVRDNSKWYPDTAILVSMIVISALAIPAFAYVLNEERQREERKDELILSPDMVESITSGKPVIPEAGASSGPETKDTPEAEEVPEPPKDTRRLVKRRSADESMKKKAIEDSKKEVGKNE